jgi:phosphatidylglycerophosphatase A
MLIAGSASLPARLALLIGVSVIGWWAAAGTELRYGPDARCIVIDEVAGMLAATLLVPWDLIHLLPALVLFRAFDILKPPPGYQVESLPGGLGVMADDLVAGFYTLLLLILTGLLVPSF